MHPPNGEGVCAMPIEIPRICANSCHFDAIDPLETTLKRVCGKKSFRSIDQHREPSTSPTFQVLARNPRWVPQERVLEIDLSPRRVVLGIV